ncbi:flagellar hook-associated protein 2, putative [Heliomicrobium modesticaldum Ice1]|uniref:Flagellar hook-associated protein 2, putative n=1 Tax=Heliobacterium modesticaldum (strain ATCC 51547 / Ice1) TaxID=498761 RepID=B0TE02_HELMI|nr:flagellar filament capping protein FliD [Heliomicrobium modesticaldum]ABZ84197.1 flagellar hook-associated protein 2, putative [Heliomicrobium modesticaldum Ice1]
MVGSISSIGYSRHIGAYRTSLVNSLSSTAAATFTPFVPSITPGSTLLENRNRYLSSVQSAREQFVDLAKQARELAGGENVFDRRSVDAGGSAAITGSAAKNASFATYNVAVTQVAKAQQNSGNAITSTALSGEAGFAAGTNQFTITGNGVNRILSVDVSVGDSGKTVLKKMADAINNAAVGVSAQVVDTTSGGVMKSQLTLTAQKTGTDNTFALTDTSGNLVAVSGAGNQTTAAQDAQYRVNGVAFTSHSNDVKLDGGKVNLTLKAVTVGDVAVKVGYDAKAITDEINSFVKSFNGTSDLLRKKAGLLGSLSRGMERFVSESRNALKDVGITVTPGNTLKVDADKLKSTLADNPGRVEEAMAGYGGFAYKVGQFAQGVSTLPLSSLAAPSSRYGDGGTYSLLRQQFGLYQQKANMGLYMPQVFGTGSFYDSYI